MPQSPADNARLKRLARSGEWICIAAFLLVASYCLFLAVTPEEAVAALQRGIPGAIVMPGHAALAAAGAVALLPVITFLYALWQTRRLFRLIGNGEFLSVASQALFLKIGKLAVAWSILGMVCHTAVVLLMTSANPPGQKQLLIEIDSGQISSVLVAVLFFTFSLLMKESAAIHEDNQHII